MKEWQERTQQLLGENNLKILAQTTVLVVGIGGVGAYAAEMLVRAGIGQMIIVDGDKVALSNINRQLVATHKTLEIPKVEVLKERLHSINPDLQLTTIEQYLTAEEIGPLLQKLSCDYIVDAIDTLAPKIELICQAKRQKIKIISSMGAGGRTNPTMIQYGDISKTYHCALAKAVRTGLKKRGISNGLPVVFSIEQVKKSAIIPTQAEKNKKSTVGTISFLPAMFGCYLAAYIINKLTINS